MINRMRKFIIVIITFWLVLLVTIFSIPRTLSYFDAIIARISETIYTGSQWVVLSDLANYDNVHTLTSIMYDLTNPEDQKIISYLDTVMYDTDATGNPILDEVFQGYTLNEVAKTFTCIEEYLASFLTYSNNTYIYPTTTVSPINLNYNQILPGEKVYINHVLLKADLLRYDPMTLSLSMSTSTNIDISDFSVEVFIDSKPFQANSPFQYTYLHTGMTRSITINANKVNFTSITSVSYSNEVRSAVTTLYQHSYQTNPFYGSWSRLPTGPSLYLTSPSTFVVSKNATTTGLYLRGSGDGSLSSLELGLTNRVPSDNPEVTIIPITIVISRGISNNGTTPNPTNIMPTIQMKVVG